MSNHRYPAHWPEDEVLRQLEQVRHSSPMPGVKCISQRCLFAENTFSRHRAGQQQEHEPGVHRRSNLHSQRHRCIAGGREPGNGGRYGSR